jgi:hypothetical protein
MRATPAQVQSSRFAASRSAIAPPVTTPPAQRTSGAKASRSIPANALLRQARTYRTEP